MANKVELIPITDIPDKTVQRLPTGIKGFDRILGGGFVPGNTVLFAGQPGVGKSTFLLQVSYELASQGYRVLYITGEEALSEIRVRAKRLGTLHPKIIASEVINLEKMLSAIRESNPHVVIIDSLQMVYSEALNKQPGTPTQISYCLSQIIEHARASNRAIITVGHSTKSNTVAGTQKVQHMVDAVFYMYGAGGENRLLFSQKNRYGMSQINWPLKMTPLGIVDAEEEEPEPVNLEEVRPSDNPDREIRLEHDALVEASKKSFSLRLNADKNIRQLFEKAFGKKGVDKIVKYDIIYTLTSNPQTPSSAR